MQYINAGLFLFNKSGRKTSIIIIITSLIGKVYYVSSGQGWVSASW